MEGRCGENGTLFLNESLATFYSRLTEKELNDIESQLEGVAESEGGEYDGHERDV